jgi:cell division protein FtsQ
MWDDAVKLRRLSNALFGVSALVMAFGVAHFAVHLPVFPLTTLELEKPPAHVAVADIEEVAHNDVRGNFFTVDIENVRKSLERLPWVRRASVRIEFPWKLKVELEEQVAAAHWNDTELVNTYGEVFAGNSNVNLPRFYGQTGTSTEVSQMYRAFNDQLAPLSMKVTHISLSPRRAWQLRLENGMALQLGREEMQQRLARFIAVYPYSLAKMASSASYVDLRYKNGFAARLPGGMQNGNQHGKKA